jgi:hypothetical protein
VGRTSLAGTPRRETVATTRSDRVKVVVTIDSTGAVLRPRLYRWLAVMPCLIFGMLGASGLTVPADEAGGLIGRMFCGIIIAVSAAFIVRILRTGIFINEAGVRFRQVGRGGFYAWAEIEAIDVTDAGEIIPWRIPVVSLRGGKLLQLDEYRTLRRNSSASIAESVERLLAEAKRQYGSIERKSGDQGHS